MATHWCPAVLGVGFAVALTLVSGAVSVYYFEQSGDLNYQVRSELVLALEASWTAARHATEGAGRGGRLPSGTMRTTIVIRSPRVPRE